MLLLDRATIESARAAHPDTNRVELDTAPQATHTAGHEGDHDGWKAALRSAHEECRLVPG